VKYLQLCVTSGFRRAVAVNCALLGYYAASSRNSLPTLGNNISAPLQVVYKYGTDK